ncbi:MAG: DNA cytosine methyltransferase [Sedimentisphaerales bacterium]|nr:DNA cytosine methyltransferase [Sedimentisphaerales bacterium]
MSGDVSNKKRLIALTEANLKKKNHHIYISGHHDFFPKECHGQSDKKNGVKKEMTLLVEGLPKPVKTDIGTNGTNGKPRDFFRRRRWVREFFEKHELKAGDVIAIERLSKYTYRIYPFESKNVREGAHIPDHWPDVDGKKPTVIDLFAGCGGMSIGLKKAGFENLLAVEWDASCCETFKTNISPRILQCAIQELENFPPCDLLVGGPPCQGFSNLGEKLPKDPRRELWRHFLRVVKDSHPLIFVMENVPPLLKSAEYEEIRRQAKKLGYNIDGRVLNAADYGTPQIRKRAFLIGSRIGQPAFPEATHHNPDTIPKFETGKLPPWRTVKDAIGDLPSIPDGKNWHIGRCPTKLSEKRYRCIPEGGNRWDLPLSLTPECWKRKTKGGTDLFGRLWWNKPSVTIRTEFYKPEKGRYLHPVEHRPITHREAARLQGFDDDFIFIGKKIEVGIQIGNAVPPPLAYNIGIAALEEIMKAKYAVSPTKTKRREKVCA